MKLVKKLNSLEIIRLLDSARTSPEPEAREILEKVFNKMSWIAALAAGKYKRFSNYQDLLQVGRMSLYRALLAFDNTKSSNIFAYIYPWVKTDVRREAWREKQYLAAHDLVSEHSEPTEDFAQSPEELYIEVEDMLAISNILNNLDTNSRFILHKSLGLDGIEPESLRDIAKELNMSHENVRQIRNKAIKKVAEIYAAM